jgi:hypothetical protein
LGGGGRLFHYEGDFLAKFIFIIDLLHWLIIEKLAAIRVHDWKRAGIAKSILRKPYKNGEGLNVILFETY